MKKVLLVLGGICPQPYAYDDVVKSSFDHLGYDEIIQIDYEPFLDKRYEWIPFYNRMRILDKRGDWWQFALHPEVREAIRADVCEKINNQPVDVQIDIVAHSLGTWVILGCPVKVNKVMLFGCPIGSRSWIVCKNVESELDKSLSLEASIMPSCWASTSNQTAIRVPAMQASPPQTPAVLVMPLPLLLRVLVRR